MAQGFVKLLRYAFDECAVTGPILHEDPERFVGEPERILGRKLI